MGYERDIFGQNGTKSGYGEAMLKKNIKKLYFYLEFLIARSFSVFAKTRDILILRTDAIGDYLLFRNFLEEIKLSGQYNNITLIGNILWKELALALDNKFVDSFIWIDRKKFERIGLYRLKIIFKICKYTFNVAVYPTYSREPQLGDWLMHLINAKSKIASIGNCSNISLKKKLSGDRFYDKLIKADASIVFEYLRNLEFFSELLHKNLNTNYELPKTYTKFTNLFSKHVVLFIGASTNSRKWNIASFLDLGVWINLTYGYEILLCGAAVDRVDIPLNLPGYMTNLAGETTLIEMIDILSQSKFVVSNETAIPHMCAARGITVFVLYNGNHFGRFIPYPRKITDKYYPIYHPEIEDDLIRYENISNCVGYIPGLDIGEIGVDKVKNRIQEVMGK